MIPYATTQGLSANMRAIAAAGWSLFVAPVDRVHARKVIPALGFHYALDNGAWKARDDPGAWDRAAFEALVAEHGVGADFVVVPDVVGNRETSLERTQEWLPRLSWMRRFVAAQDGMEESDIDALDCEGIFLGGTTEWKLATMRKWGRYARGRGLGFHVGRVNSRRRIALAALAGADSFDGSSATIYGVTLPKLDAERRQLVLRDMM